MHGGHLISYHLLERINFQLLYSIRIQKDNFYCPQYFCAFKQGTKDIYFKDAAKILIRLNVNNHFKNFFTR